MLKTITKFVVERRRLVRQRRQQVIGEGDSDDPAGHSEVPQREGDNSDSSEADFRGPARNLPKHNSANRPRPRFGAR